MSKINQSLKEKSCIALGGLDGARFDVVLGSLLEEMSSLKRFVAESCVANDVASGPMVSLGHEVQLDAICLKHVENKLVDGLSQLITLLALTRGAAETVASGNTD